MINTLRSKFNAKMENSHLRELLTGSSVAFALKILGMACGYIFVFLVSRSYGAKGMGIYSLSLAVLMILEMVGTMGFRSSILRFVGQFSKEDQRHQIRPLYKHIMELTLLVSVVLGIIVYAFARPLALFVFHDPQLTAALRIISFTVPAATIVAVNTEFIRGLKNIPFSEYLRNVNRPLFGMVLLLIPALFVGNAQAPVIVWCLAIVISFILSAAYITAKLQSFPVGAAGTLSKREILKISSPMMITAFSFLLMGKIDTIMLGMFSTTENVGIYNVALKLASVTSFILYAVNTIAAPKFSELFWSNKMEELKKVVRFSSKLIFGFSFPVLILFMVFPKFFVGLFGQEFIAGQSALIILTIGQFVNAASGSVGYFMNMTGREIVYRNIILAATAINITLNYILIPVYGLNGAAVATAISMSMWNITSVIYIRAKLKVNTFYPGFG